MQGAMSFSTLSGAQSSSALFCLLFIALVYVLGTYLPVSYTVESTSDSDKQPFRLGPSAVMPKIGVEVRLANGTALNDPTYASILFLRPRAKMKSSTSRLSQLAVNHSRLVLVPGVRCSFVHPDGSLASSEAWCTDMQWEDSNNEGVTDSGSSAAFELLAMSIAPCTTSLRSGAVCRPLSESTHALQSATAILFVETLELQAQGPGAVGEARPLSRQIQILSVPLDDSVLLLSQLHLTSRTIVRKGSHLASGYGGWEEDVAFSTMELKEIRKRDNRTPLLQTSVQLSHKKQTVEIRSSRGWLDLLLLMAAVKAVLDLLWAMPLAFHRLCAVIAPAKKLHLHRMAKKGSWPSSPSRSLSLDGLPPTSKAANLFHPLPRTPRHHLEGHPLLAPRTQIASFAYQPSPKGQVDHAPGHHKRSQSLPGYYEISLSQARNSDNEADTLSCPILESPSANRECDEESLTPRKSTDLSSLESIWTHSNPIFSPSPSSKVLRPEERSTARFEGRRTDEPASDPMEIAKLDYGDEWMRSCQVARPCDSDQQVDKQDGVEAKPNADGEEYPTFAMSKGFSLLHDRFHDVISGQEAVMDVDLQCKGSKGAGSTQTCQPREPRQCLLQENRSAHVIAGTVHAQPDSAEVNPNRSRPDKLACERELATNTSTPRGSCSTGSQRTGEESGNDAHELDSRSGSVSETGEGDLAGTESTSVLWLLGEEELGKRVGPGPSRGSTGDDKSWTSCMEEFGARGGSLGEVRGTDGDIRKSSSSSVKGSVGGEDHGMKEGNLLARSWDLERSHGSLDWDLRSEASSVSGMSVCSVSSKASDEPGKTGRRKGKDASEGRRSGRERGTEGSKKAAWGAGPGVRITSRTTRSSTGSMKVEGLRTTKSSESGDGEASERRASGSHAVAGRALALAGVKSPPRSGLRS